VPTDSFNNQPLYGAGKTLKSLYVQTDEDQIGDCFKDDFVPTYCLISVRNNPMHKWTPAMIAWPTSAEEVQLVVNFALHHDMCISVSIITIINN
jgi:hypothetical protein